MFRAGNDIIRTTPEVGHVLACASLKMSISSTILNHCDISLFVPINTKNLKQSKTSDSCTDFALYSASSGHINGQLRLRTTTITPK